MSEDCKNSSPPATGDLERKTRSPWVRLLLEQVPLTGAATFTIVRPVAVCACGDRLELQRIGGREARDDYGEAEAVALKLWNFAGRHRRCGA